MSQEQPVDLDALEKELWSWAFMEIRHKMLAAISELRELRAKKSTIFEAITTRGQLALEELENLRAWKARLGPVAGWFPSLGRPGVHPYPAALADEARALLDRAKETP